MPPAIAQSAKLISHLKTAPAANAMCSTPQKPAGSLRILHTSDWHLGKLLHDEPRYDEFSQLLDWLLKTIASASVDVLIIAGDIFDTMTPSNRAEHLYHEFLAKAYRQGLKHIIIIAGNHDSPTSLTKTRDVLGVLGVHVIGTPTDPSEAVLTLYDADTPIAIVLTVPYLRDRDVRSSSDTQSINDKTEQLLAGVASYYHTAASTAKATQAALMAKHHKYIPLIATGHLFVAGASVSSADDGMRDLQVGTLGQISATIFDESIDYVALGHIHAAQKIAGCEHIRYCGSPMAMGFGEIGRIKQMLLIDFPASKIEPSIEDGAVSTEKQPTLNDHIPDLFSEYSDDSRLDDGSLVDDKLISAGLVVDSQMISTHGDHKPPASVDDQHINRPAPIIHALPVPIFQSLVRISGDMDAITEAINHLNIQHADDNIWLEIAYTGNHLIANLRQCIGELLEGCPHQLLSLKNKRLYQGSLGGAVAAAPLDSFDVGDIFDARLLKEDLDDNEKTQLKAAYAKLIKTIYETDKRAE